MNSYVWRQLHIHVWEIGTFSFYCVNLAAIIDILCCCVPNGSICCTMSVCRAVILHVVTVQYTSLLDMTSCDIIWHHWVHIQCPIATCKTPFPQDIHSVKSHACLWLLLPHSALQSVSVAILMAGVRDVNEKYWNLSSAHSPKVWRIVHILPHIAHRSSHISYPI